MSDKAGPRDQEAGSRPPAGRGARAVSGAVRNLLGAPFTRQAWRELLYAVAGAPLGVAGFALTVAFLGPATVLTISLIGTVLGLVLFVTGLRVARLVSVVELGCARQLHLDGRGRRDLRRSREGDPESRDCRSSSNSGAESPPGRRLQL